MFDLPPLRVCPETPPLQRLLRRAERLIEQKEYDRAITSLRRAIGIGADEYACTLHIAALYSLERRWEGAFGAVERAISLSPLRLAAHEMLMTMAMEAGDMDRTEAACHALIKLMPRHIPAYTTLGAIYMQRGQTNSALRVIGTLIRIDPFTPAHYFKKALLCQHNNEVCLAVEAFALAIRLDPEGHLAEAARDALESLDAHQINQILLLAMDDLTFRICLSRDCADAAEQRGFVLSETGNQILQDLCGQVLHEESLPNRPYRYN